MSSTFKKLEVSWGSRGGSHAYEFSFGRVKEGPTNFNYGKMKGDIWNSINSFSHFSSIIPRVQSNIYLHLDKLIQAYIIPSVELNILPKIPVLLGVYYFFFFFTFNFKALLLLTSESYSVIYQYFLLLCTKSFIIIYNRHFCV